MSLSFRAQSAKKTGLRFAIFNISEKFQNIFEIGLRNTECSYKNRSHWKNISKAKIRRHVFVVCVNLATVKIWGQSDKFPISLAFLHCPLQVKNLIRENSTKYVNQTGNFYFRPKLKTAISLPISNLFQWFLFYIRDFIWITTLTEKSKFEENCRSEGILQP